MKKSILSIILVVFFLNHAKSQITKNNWLLGGNINYSSTSFNSENFGVPHNYNVLQINPNIGYFMIDKFAAGIKIGIEKNNVKEPSTSSSNRYTNFNIGPFVRYYLLKPTNNINILTEGVYLYGFEKGNTEKTSKSTFLISAGPVIYFNTVVGMEFLVGYSTQKFSGINGNNNTIKFGIGLQVHLEKDE